MIKIFLICENCFFSEKHFIYRIFFSLGKQFFALAKQFFSSEKVFTYKKCNTYFSSLTKSALVTKSVSELSYNSDQDLRSLIQLGAAVEKSGIYYINSDWKILLSQIRKRLCVFGRLVENLVYTYLTGLWESCGDKGVTTSIKS